MRKCFLSVIFLTIIASLSASSEDSCNLVLFDIQEPNFALNKKPDYEIKGIEVIGNFGAYYADKQHAAFYNGRPNNINNINYVFDNYYWREQIKELMRSNLNRDSVLLSPDSYPENMKYTLAMYVGFGVRYNYSSAWALNIQFNVCKLTAKDVFTLQVFPAFDNESKSYVNYGVFGKESRTIIDIGAVKTFRTKEHIRPILEFGASFNNTLVKENFIVVEDQKFNIIDIYAGRNYIPNSNVQEYEMRQGGLGVGLYVGGGVKWMFNQFLSLETTLTVYSSMINLENYAGMGLHFAPMFRIVASPALFINND